MNQLQLGAAVALVAVSLSGCTGAKPLPSDPSGPDFITITSIAPPNGTTLAPGNSVTISAKVDYQESCGPDATNPQGGVSISMTIEDQSGNFLSPTVTKGARYGRGSASLSGSLTVPAAGVNQVKVVLREAPTALSCLLRLFDSSSTSVSYPVGH